MNKKEADSVAEKIVLYVNHEFRNIYPDAFVHCSTTDPDTYKSANPCMYSWYLKAVSAIRNLDFSPNYQQTDEQVVESDWSCVMTFFVDIRHTDDFLKFLIENVKIGY